MMQLSLRALLGGVFCSALILWIVRLSIKRSEIRALLIGIMIALVFTMPAMLPVFFLVLTRSAAKWLFAFACLLFLLGFAFYIMHASDRDPWLPLSTCLCMGTFVVACSSGIGLAAVSRKAHDEARSPEQTFRIPEQMDD